MVLMNMINTEIRMTQRAGQFDECFEELSEKARNDLEFKIYALRLSLPYIGDNGARELIMQVARFVENRLEDEHV